MHRRPRADSSDKEAEIVDELKLSPQQISEGLPGEGVRGCRERRNSSQRQESELFFNHDILGRKLKIHDSCAVDTDLDILPSQLSITPPPGRLTPGAARRLSTQQLVKESPSEALPKQPAATPMSVKRQRMRGPPRSTRSPPLPEENRQTFADSRSAPSRPKSLPAPTVRRCAARDVVPPVPALPGKEYLLPGPGPQHWEFGSVPFVQIPGHYPFRRESGVVESGPAKRENSSPSASKDAQWPLRSEPLRAGTPPKTMQPPAAKLMPEKPALRQSTSGDAERRRTVKPNSGASMHSVRPVNQSTATLGMRAGTSGKFFELNVRRKHNRTSSNCDSPLKSIESIYLNMHYEEWMTKERTNE
ncbi:hypothetical protein ACMFMF_004101 [Clarireedia jacksonii]